MAPWRRGALAPWPAWFRAREAGFRFAGRCAGSAWCLGPWAWGRAAGRMRSGIGEGGASPHGRPECMSDAPRSPLKNFCKKNPCPRIVPWYTEVMEDEQQPHESPALPDEAIPPRMKTVPTIDTILEMSHKALQDEAQRLLCLIRDQAREVIRINQRLQESESKVQSIALEEAMRLQDMLGRRFSEMRAQDIPALDSRFRAVMLFSEYQQYRRTAKDVRDIHERDFKRMREIMADIRMESELDILNRKGYSIRSGHSGLGKTGSAKASARRKTEVAEGQEIGEEGIEVSPEFAAALGLTR